MLAVNMFEAKTQLSKLVDYIERKQESEIIIARNGRAIAKLVPLEAVNTNNRIGIAKGAFDVPDNIDQHNDEVAALFLVSAP
jgi:antitoxin (DNA-binding transcriptional repressor) of toxin-antitoxin stability system